MEEIGNGSVVSVMSILKGHTQELRPTSCDKPVPELKCVRPLNFTILNDTKKVMEQAELRVKTSIAKPVGLPTSSSSISLHPSEAKKRRGNAVDVSFNMGAREKLNAIILRVVYSDNLSFNFIRNPYYAMSFTCHKQCHLGLYPSRV